jgi:hypothetical protein
MAYIELLSASETDFRRAVEEIEADPLYTELRSLGVVRRRGGRGRMPAEAQEELLDQQVADIVRRYRLDRLPGGLDTIQAVLQDEGVEAVARRLGASPAEVRRLARFLAPPRREPEARGGRRRAEEEAPQLEDYVAGAPAVDTEKATAIVRDFVLRHRLSEHQLVADFLHGEDSPERLARHYHTTEGIIQQVQAAVNHVLTADEALGPRVTAATARARRTDRSVAIVGRVHLRAGEPALHFGEDTGYGLRYVIDPTRFGMEFGDTLPSSDPAPPAGSELDGVSPNALREEAEAFLALLRHVNQRRSVQCRVVALIFEKQKRHFASGSDLDLVPLGQAEVARELKEHQSTVSRAVRDRYLETPYGTHELQWYCQRKRDVVRRLAAAHPELSDRELQHLLAERYHCRIARRTVAYHRASGPGGG